MGYVIFTLLQDNPCNTTIVNEVDVVEYVVETDLTNLVKPVTRVTRDDGELVAEWVWRGGLRSDLLTFRNEFPVSASSWLKKSIVPFANAATFRDRTKEREFKWTNNSPGLLPQLLGPDSKTEPVARFVRSHRDPTAGVLSSKLFIGDSVQDVQDEIVVSFLLLERRRRENEAGATNRPGAFGTIVFSS